MKKYGFECEYWVMPLDGKNSAPILVPLSIPHDECGYLAEVRGEPHTDPLKAAHLMLAEEELLQRKARDFVAGKCILIKNGATRLLDKKFIREAMRRFGKNKYPVERGNLYGKDYRPSDKLARAGLHVHFSNIETFKYKDGSKERGFSYNIQQDMPKIIRTLDVAFAAEIKRAQRLPGFYELKSYGFEYRSLPCDVDPRRVAQVITEHKL